jgi:hypothetical protein
LLPVQTTSAIIYTTEVHPGCQTFLKRLTSLPLFDNQSADISSVSEAIWFILSVLSHPEYSNTFLPNHPGSEYQINLSATHFLPFHKSSCPNQTHSVIWNSRFNFICDLIQTPIFFRIISLYQLIILFLIP